MGEYTNAKINLEEGFKFAQEKGLQEISTQIMREKMILDKEVHEWEESVKFRLSIPDRIDKSELNSYISKAMRTIDQL
jgi:hypothetical protein